MSDLVIIGGGGAGMTAALTARKINPRVDVTIITKESLSYSSCALPFVISGEIPSMDDITSSMEAICQKSGIKLVLDSATSIDTKKKVVSTERSGLISYDSLIIATGGRTMVPPIKGADLRNILTLYTVDDAEKIMAQANKSKKAVVIGGGAIGIEAAAALVGLGLKVTLVEGFPHVLFRFFDDEYLAIIEDELKAKGIEIILSHFVEEVMGKEKVDAVKVAGKEIPSDLIIMATGVRPNSEIAEKAGIKTMKYGILTDWLMQTNIKDVYAAGDCAYSRSMITGELMLSQLGTTAIRHGTVAGMNAVGESVAFEGALGSMALKIFDLKVGRTGLTEREAKEAGIDVISGRAKATTKAKYYPGHKEVDVKLIFDAASKELIGGQIIGGGAVAKKIDLIALGISKHATVEDLIGLGYSYTPPLAPSHNVIVLAAENAYRKMKRAEEARRRRF
ncbi:MAG: FAD-dependent oxidoreductase [Candidatus Altiarchaeota archaeon]|nr:FAD-dependent oxidoreductase [Candidatus Altiarchaeota archaeon]